jgi:tetratricopeptide (TPR) repeat protein
VRADSEPTPLEATSNPIAVCQPKKLSRYLSTDWFRCLFLALTGFLARSPALQGERIWDDQYLVHQNPFMKSPLLILETFRHHLFLDSFSAHYRPIQNISYFIDYFFWNTDEFGFHLTNVLLHVGAGILLYFLVRQLFGSFLLRRVRPPVRNRFLQRMPWISHGAFLVALLWTVHPVHSAAIDYISGRADSLAFFFAAAAWLLFLRAQGVKPPLGRALMYSLAAIAALVALLSREIALIWVVLFLAHVFLVERNLALRLRMGALLCCAALILTYAGLRQLPANRVDPLLQQGWQAPIRAVLMTRALGDYARLMVFPWNLHMERTLFDPANYRNNADWRRSVGTEYLSILGLLFLAILVFGCTRKGRGQAARIFGASWFLAGYLPISNIVLLNATVAEHWLYLPSVGFLIFLAGCAMEVPGRHWRMAVAAVALVAAAGLSARSYVRSTDWINAETFYRRTLAAGGTTPRTGLNLAQIYARRGQYAQAEKILRKVLKVMPDYPTAQNSLASALWHEGKKKEAEALFAVLEKNSLRNRAQYPRTWMGALNLARVRHNDGNNQSALAILERARKDYPQTWEIISYESELLRETQGPDAVLKLVENFAHNNWWHYSAYLALGQLYAQKDDAVRAEAALQHASWLDIHDTAALNLIALMRMRQDRFEEAAQTQRRAIARQPDEPHQYLLLSNILKKMGEEDQARAALAQASRLRALATAQTVVN